MLSSQAFALTNWGGPRVVIQRAPHLPYCGIDGVLGIEKVIFFRNPLLNLVTGRELPGFLDEYKEEITRCGLGGCNGALLT